MIGFQDFLFSTPWTSALPDERRRRVGKMAATTAGVGRLEEEALRRKERLKALREKTGRKVRNAKEGPWLRKPAFAPGTGNDRAGNYEEKA